MPCAPYLGSYASSPSGTQSLGSILSEADGGGGDQMPSHCAHSLGPSSHPALPVNWLSRLHQKALLGPGAQCLT